MEPNNRIYLNNVDGGEFLVGSIFSGIFGLFSSLIQSQREGADNERLRELISANSRLMNEIREQNEEKENREKEEANIKRIKQEEDERLFREKIEQAKNKINNIPIINDNNDEYIFLKQNLENNFNNIWFQALNNSDLNNSLKNKFTELIKHFSFENSEINKMNIYLVGKTGTGKTTFINSICPSYKGEAPIINVGTKETIEYNCQCKDKKHYFITFIDTRGIELDKNFGANYVLNHAETFINQKLEKGNPNEVIHCILFTLTGDRFETIEINILKKMRKIYKEKNIPIILVYTKCVESEDYIAKIKEKLNKILNEEITDKPDGIRFIEILAKEKKIRKETLKPLNVSKLLKMCYENFKYSCHIAQKRCLLVKIKTELFKIVDDKNINENSLFDNENEPDSLINYFKLIFNEFSPFDTNNINFPLDLISEIKNKIGEYAKKIFDNYINKELEEIANFMINSQINFFSQNQNFNLGDSIKTKEDWISSCRNELNDQVKNNFVKFALKIIIKEMNTYVIDSLKSNIKNNIEKYLESDDCKNLLEENSKCKLKLLVGKLNQLIKEIHQNEDDCDEEISEIEEEEED